MALLTTLLLFAACSAEDLPAPAGEPASARLQSTVTLVEPPGSAEIAPALNATPLPLSFGTHDAQVRVGVEFVDAIVSAVLNHETALLQQYVVRREIRCESEPRGLPALRCGEGESDGTPFEVFTYSVCESEFVRTQYTAAVIDRFLSPQSGPESAPLRLFAVAARAEEASDSGTQYQVVFAFDQTEGRAVWISEEGITHFTLGCGPTPPIDLLRSGGASLLLAPAEPE